MQVDSTKSTSGGKIAGAVTKEIGMLAALATVAEVAVGEYTGTTALLDVPLAFDPVFVAVYNLTDGDFVGFGWNTTNVAAKSAKILAAAGPVSVVQGILFAAAGSKKFQVGTDAGFNENAKVYQYVAFGV